MLVARPPACTYSTSGLPLITAEDRASAPTGCWCVIDVLAAARAPGEARSRGRSVLGVAVTVVAQGALDLAGERSAEDARVKAARVFDAGGRVDGLDVEFFDRTNQIAHAAVPQAPRLAVAHGLECSAAAWRDRGPARRLDLDRGDSELLHG